MNADRHRPSSTRRGAAVRRLAAILLLAATTVGSAGCLSVTRQDEIEMGRDYAARLEQELPLIRTEGIRGRVAEIGDHLASHSSRPGMPYEFHVVNTDAINAFAVPGGFVYMNRGLLEEAENMSQVAGVLAHEIGHVVARHSAEQLEKARTLSLGYGLVSVLFGQPEGVAAAGINLGANFYFARHSRADEAEADAIAVSLMVESGWSPRGLVGFFRIMLEERDRQPNALEALFASHPLTEDRIRDVRRRIDRIDEARLAGLRSDTDDFDSFQALLRDHPPPPEEFRVEEDG